MAFKPVDWINDKIFNSKNKERAVAPKVDPNAYQYGGGPGGADEAADRYRQTAEGAQNRAAAQASNVATTYGHANQDRSLGMQARQGQASLAQLMLNRATGATPSIAQMQADRQMQQVQSAQASMASSARGAGALAMAQQNAANNVANAQADISSQAQINGANERMQAEGAASNAYGAMRGGDQQSQGQDASQSQFQTTSAVNQNQFNAAQRAQQRAQNDQFTQGMTQNEIAVRNSQLTAGMNQQAQQSSNSLTAAGINAGVGGQNASMNKSTGDSILGLGQSAAGIAFGTPAAKAKGGPVAGRTPYLVGEQGPELIVPKKDGFVLTADQTRQALGDSPADAITRLFDRGQSQARGASLASIMGAANPPREAPRSGNAAGDFVRSLLGMPGREDGGPIDGGGAPTSTWGTGYGVDPATTMSGAENEWQAGMAAGLSGAGDRERDEHLHASPMAVSGFSPGIKGGKDEPLRRIDEASSSGAHAKEAQGLDLSDREAYEAQGADYRLGRAKKIDRAGGDATPPRTLASFLSENGKKAQQAAAAIDTSYHGSGGGYAPPQLIPLPARAMGGPISAGGGLVPMTASAMRQGNGVGGGIELGASGGMTRGDLARAGTGLGDPSLMRGMVGGGGITGGSSMGGQAIPGGSYGGAREDGGPVDSSKAYLVGEKGPEIVVGKYDTKLSPAEERAYASWKTQVAPHDSGEDYDYRGAFKAGATPGPDGHWVDTFKKPNHPTFSVESQYARGADAAKAGRWSGERFIPAKTYDASRPFGDRFVPIAAPASAPASGPPPAAKKVYNYDASKPFGERFVPATTREPVSFERTDPKAEADANLSEKAARTNARDALEQALTSPTLAAAGPAAAASVGNFITSLFERAAAKKKRTDDDEDVTPPAREGRPRSLAALMGTGR